MMDLRIMRRIVGITAIELITANAVYAQQPTKPVEATQKEKEKEKDKDREKEEVALPSARNIGIELTITDQAGTGEAAKKVVSMIVADRNRGSIRTQGASGRTLLILNVDARPTIGSGSSIMTQLTIEYMPKPDPEHQGSDVPLSQLNQSILLVLESGKPTVISQAADPASNRKITVEVKATILK